MQTVECVFAVGNTSAKSSRVHSTWIQVSTADWRCWVQSRHRPVRWWLLWKVRIGLNIIFRHSKQMEPSFRKLSQNAVQLRMVLVGILVYAL